MPDNQHRPGPILECLQQWQSGIGHNLEGSAHLCVYGSRQGAGEGWGVASLTGFVSALASGLSNSLCFVEILFNVSCLSR